MPKPGDLIGGRYEIERILGQGGFGAVYAAHHARSGRRVAVKWLLPQLAANTDVLQRFMAEARTTAAIEHPNVVTIVDVDEDGGAPYLVMEMLRGETLRERLDRVRRLSPTEAVHLLLPAMRGVAGAHQEGVIHRDLKPDNIFLCQGKDGTPREAKVLDFGISKLTHAETGPKTQTGTVVGTPAYMSPEQMRAPKTADVRFDVYAMGVVLYEAITGVTPYRSESLFDLIHQIGLGNAPPPSRHAPHVSAALDGVVMRAMHHDAAQRFGSMQDLIDALAPLLAHGQLESGALEEAPAAPVALAPSTPYPAVTPPTSGVQVAARPPSGSHRTEPLLDATPQGIEAAPQRQRSSAPPSDVPLSGMPQPAPQSGVHATPRKSSPVVFVAVGAAALIALAGVSTMVLMAGDGRDAPVPPASHGAEQPAATVEPPHPVAPVLADPPAPAREQTPVARTPLTYSELGTAGAGSPVEMHGAVFYAVPSSHEALILWVDGLCEQAPCPVHISLPDEVLTPPAGAGVRLSGVTAGTYHYATRAGTDRTIPSVRATEVLRAPDAQIGAVPDDIDVAEPPRTEPPRTEPPPAPTSNRPASVRPRPSRPGPQAAPIARPFTPPTPVRRRMSSDEI